MTARLVEPAVPTLDLLDALELIRLHSQTMADDPTASHRGCFHTIARIAEKAIEGAKP